MTKKNANSPYQKYKKTPYRYSEEYRKWKQAARDNNKDAVEFYDRAWKRKFLHGVSQ